MSEIIDKIPNEKQIKEFANVVNNNSRTILSARFGDGKTCFLNDFKTKYKEKKTFITIHPINYQVANNKDIFEYIKRDILIQLLICGDYTLEEGFLDKYFCLFSFVNENKGDFLKEILTDYIPNILGTPSLGKFIGQCLTIKDRYKKHCENIKDESKEIKIEKYLEFFSNQKGGIYEFDLISKMIFDIVLEIKTKNNKEVVLIIEDLDRIDPAHIFRLLNIFSAHLDCENVSVDEHYENEKNNKFGFDKIILVCHYDNIKNIYHHLYGSETDFLGYINKFSTALPYEYSLKKGMEEWLQNAFGEQYKKYPKIYDSLISHIINNKYIFKKDKKDEEKYLQENNLRKIKENIEKSKNFYKGIFTTITNDYEDEFNISKDCDFFKFLSFIKIFGIEIDFFLKSLPERCEELPLMISTWWFINTDNKKTCFRISYDNIYKCNKPIFSINRSEIGRSYYIGEIINKNSFLEFDLNNNSSNLRFNELYDYDFVKDIYDEYIK